MSVLLDAPRRVASYSRRALYFARSNFLQLDPGRLADSTPIARGIEQRCARDVFTSLRRDRPGNHDVRLIHGDCGFDTN